jgi:hypothetical protein
MVVACARDRASAAASAAAQDLLDKEASGLVALLKDKRNTELLQLYKAYKNLPACIDVIAVKFKARAARRVSLCGCAASCKPMACL